MKVTGNYDATLQSRAEQVKEAQVRSSQAKAAKTGTAKTEAAQAQNEQAVSQTAQGATVEISGAGLAALSENKTYTADQVKNMSQTDRTALVQQMKADQESYQSRFISMVQEMMSGQTNAYGQSNNIWRFLASGNYTVDAETKAQAQQSISEDGYYGVKQTSQRMFQFAMALTGGDATKMQEMKAAVEKGYKQAEKTWGGSLPEISQQTLAATNQLFDDYLAGNTDTAAQDSTTAVTE